MSHEIKVRRDIRFSSFDKVISVIQGHTLLAHEVGYCYSDGSADASEAVDEYTKPLRSSFIYSGQMQPLYIELLKANADSGYVSNETVNKIRTGMAKYQVV